MSRVVVLAFAAVACTTPDLKITYHVADGVAGPSCGSTECGDVPMACDAVLFLRVLRPSDPVAPFISICEDVPANTKRDLCAIGQIDLPATKLPREVLEVQVTVWPRDKVFDPDTGLLDCGRVSVEFDATMGFPVPVGSNLQNPAFGGRAFYNPGDTETVVTLGCIDPSSINQTTCAGGNSIQITSTIGDFENLPFSVSPTVGDRLAVAVGEPEPFDDGSVSGHRLNASNLHALERTVVGPTPVWGGGIDDTFFSSTCIQVLEDSGQATSTLRCRNVLLTDTQLDLPGVRLPKATLDQVLGAIGAASFPEAGLTIGIVLDHVGNPSTNKVVTSTQGTVEYLDSSRSALAPGMTTASGIFVSRDAPYGTSFATAQTNQAISAMGGLVEGKVTVVVLQFDIPQIGE